MPVLGFVLDSQAQRIRPLLGVPGAAVIAAPLDAGLDIADAVFSPRQDYAFVLTKPDRGVNVLQFLPDGVSVLSISGVAAAPDRMWLSPSGSAAALYHQDTGALQIVTGLPASGTLAREISITATGQKVTALAISDDGQIVIAGIDQSQVVLEMGADGGTASLPLGGNIQALAFRPHTQIAAAATDANQVFLLTGIPGNPQTTLIAGSQDGIAGPNAVEFSSDGQRVIVANAGNGTLTLSDLTASTTTTLNCGCNPAGLYRLKGPAVFRLTDATNPLLILDGTTTPSRILFVPDPSGSTSQGNNE